MKAVGHGLAGVRANEKKSVPLNAQLAETLLHQLSSDDGFREQFRSNPLLALKSIGYETPERGKMTACGLVPQAEPEPFSLCEVGVLASKESILEAWGALRATLVQGLAYNTPTFEATTLAARRKN